MVLLFSHLVYSERRSRDHRDAILQGRYDGSEQGVAP